MNSNFHIILLLCTLAMGCGKSEQSRYFTPAIVKSGIVNGTDTGDELPAVLKVRVLGGTCTAIIVGLNPLTVITANHCVKGYLRVPFEQRVPAVSHENFYSWNAKDSYTREDHFLRTEWDEYPRNWYTNEEGNRSLDIAVVTFSKKDTVDMISKLRLSEKDIFTVAPPVKYPSWGDKIRICGYGLVSDLASWSDGSGFGLNCGNSLLVTENINYDFTKDLWRELHGDTYRLGNITRSPEDRSLFVKYSHTVIQKELSHFGERTRLGIGPLTDEDLNVPSNETQKGYSQINNGDSGGPWFVTEKNGTLHLLGVSSSIRAVKIHGLILAGLAWRIDHDSSIRLLMEAREGGADIRGLDSLIESKKIRN